MSVQSVIVWLREPFEAEVVQELNAYTSKFSVVRRCADYLEAEGAINAGLGQVLIANAQAPGIDADFIDRVHANNVFVLLVCDDSLDTPSIGEDARCEGNNAQDVVATLTTGLQDWLFGGETEAPAQLPPAPDIEEDTPGRIMVVWGTAGAPGRSTMSINLALRLAGLQRPVTLVDADARAPSLTQMLGFELDASGLAAAASLRQRGLLDRAALRGLRTPINKHAHILTGLTQSDRWHQLRPESVGEIIRTLSRMGDVVVDLSDGLSHEDPAQLTFVPSREDLNLEILRLADLVIVVARADAVGLTRLAHLMDECDEREVSVALVVINRARVSAAGVRAHDSIRAVLRTVLPGVPHVIVDESPDVDEAVLRGMSVDELHPDSRYVRSIDDIISTVGIATIPAPRPRSRLRGRVFRKRAKPRGRHGRRIRR
ncbi:MAG: hypothetical protein Q4P05_07345 [Actinomycetaceae bacterium]|nr:hypothetical protein [Actinomycetaceae bacterium]